MHTKTLPLLLTGLVALSGCRVDDPTQLSPSQLEGVGSDALIVNGTVRVFPLVGGDAMARTETDTEGRYTIRDFKAPEGLYRVRLEGGYYVEEASGTKVTLQDGQFLEALVQHVPGQPINAMLTPATTLSSALAQYKIDHGQAGSVAVSGAASEISSLYGVDIHGTWPANITDPKNSTFSLNSELEYGFVQAGRSELVKTINEINGFTGHEQYTSIELGMLGFMDVRYDGLLDGIGREGTGDTARQLAMGTYKLSRDTYRGDHARAIIRSAGESYNQVKIPATDLVPGAENLAGSIEPVFGDAPTGSLDSDGPELSWQLSEGQSHNLTTTIAATASDFVGVNSVNLYVNDQFVAEASDNEDILFEVNTLNFSEGPAKFTLEAFDNLGNRSELEIGQLIDNSGPSISVTSPDLANSTNYKIEGTVSDSYNAIEYVSVNGIEANVDGENWFIQVPTPEPVNQFIIKAIDAVGEETTLSRDILVDTEVPTIVAFPSTGTFVDLSNGDNRVLSLDQKNDGFALQLDQNNFTLGSLSLDRTALNSAGISFFSFEVSDGVSKNSTLKEELNVEYRALISGDVVRNWTKVPLSGDSYLLPLTVEYLSQYLEIVQRDDKVRIDVRVTDKATNEATFSWETPLELVLHRIIYHTDNLDRNQIYSYRYIGATGGMVNFCPVNQGSCNINFASNVSNIQSIMDGVRYVEPFNEQVVTSRDRIVGYTNFNGTEVSQYFSPLSSVFAGYFESSFSSLEDFESAYSSAKASVEADLGLNPMEVGVVDPKKSESLTIESKHGLLLEALSKEAYDINTGFSEDVNSISLAWTSYRDLRDGVVDGTENGIVTKLSGNQIGHRELIDRLGKGVIAVAEEFDLPYISNVVDFAGEIYTPTEPSVNIHLSIDSVAGNLSVNPTISADSELIYELTVNGIPVGGDNTSWTINTSKFPDGPTEVKVSVTDRFGQSDSDSRIVVFDNTGPTIKQHSKHITVSDIVDSRFEVLDETIGVKAVTINSSLIGESEERGYFNRRIGLSAGFNPVVVSAEDELGNKTQKTFTVARVVDVPRPVAGSIELISSAPDGHHLQAKLPNAVIEAEPNQSLIVDTENFDDGLTSVEILYTNESGSPDSLSLGDYTIDNTAPVIAQVSPHLVDTSSLHAQFDVSDATLSVANVVVNGSSATYDNETGAYSRTISLSPGYTGVTVEVEDELGNSTSKFFTVARLARLPGDYTGSFDLIGQDPNGNDIAVQVNETDISLEGSQYRIDTSTFPDGVNTVTVSYTNESGLTETLNYADYVFDNNAPVVAETSPHITSSGTYTVDYNAVDDGSEVVSFQINGQEAARSGDQFTRTVALDPGFNTFTIRAEDRLGLVNNQTFTIARVTESARDVKGSFNILPKTPAGQDIVASVGNDTVAAPAGQFLAVDTTVFNDGVTPVTVSFTNQSGRADTLELGSYVFDNTAPAIVELSDHLVTSNSLNTQFSVDDETLNVASVQINGQEITGADDVYSRTMALESGFNSVTVTTSDTLGNSRTQTFDVARLTTLSGDYDGSYHLIETPDQGVMTVLVNGTFIDDTGSQFLIDTTDFSDGEKTIDVEYTNASGREDSFQIVGAVFDNNAPEIEEASTHLTTASQMDIVLDVVDAGTEVTQVTIDGLSTVRSGDRFKRQFNLTPGYNRFTVSATDRMGKVRTQNLTIGRIQSTAGHYKGTLELLGSTPTGMLTEASVSRSLFQANTGDSLSVDTSAMVDGTHDISVSFTNETGSTDTLDLGSYVFDNTAPVIEELSDHLLTSTSATLQYSVTDGTVGINQVDIEGLTTSSGTSTYSQALTLGTGNNIITVEATDELGNVASEDYLVVVLDKLPGNYDGSVKLVRTVPSGNSLRVFVDDTEVGPNGSYYEIDTSSYDDGTYPVRYELVNASGRKDTVSYNNYVFDNYAPALSEISQHILTGSSQTVRIEAVDGGSGVDRVTINGSDATFDGNFYSRNVTLASDFTMIEVSAWDKMGKRSELDFSIARVTNLSGAYNGTLDILENLPSGSNAEVEVDGFSIVAGEGQDIQVETSSFIDGYKSIVVNYTNENGRTDSINLGQYFFDNTPPSLEFTSSTLVGHEEYTLTMDIADPGEGTGINKISIDGIDTGYTKIDDSVTKEVIISDAEHEFTVSVTDHVGNTTTGTLLVEKDIIDPSISIASSKARVWNNSTGDIEYISDLSSALTEGKSLHHLYSPNPKAPVSSSVNVNDVSDQHWIRLIVSDLSNSESSSTQANDLQVEYRYLIDGQLIKDWSPATKRYDDEYYVTLGTAMLGNVFQLTRSDLMHVVETRVIDSVGNTSIDKQEFMVTVQVGNELSESGSAFTSYNWEDLELNTLQAGISDNTISDIEGVYTNDTALDVWIAVDKSPAVSIYRDQTETIFDNVGTWTYSTQWFNKCFKYDGSCGWVTLSDGSYTVGAGSPEEHSINVTNGSTTGSKIKVSSKSLPSDGVHEDTRKSHSVTPGGMAQTPACGSLQNPQFYYYGLTGGSLNQEFISCGSTSLPVYYGKVVTRDWNSTSFGERSRSASENETIYGDYSISGESDTLSTSTHKLFLIPAGSSINLSRIVTFNGFDINESVSSIPNEWTIEDDLVEISTNSRIRVIVDQGEIDPETILKQPSDTLFLGGLEVKRTFQ